MIIACRCGQDSDCNPANAGGVFFARVGASQIPPRFTEKLDLQRKYSYSEYTVPMLLEVSEKLARAAVLRAGGKIEKDAQGEDVFLIPKQTPKPGKAKQCQSPGPVAYSPFTAEEMQQIAPPQKKKQAARSRLISIYPAALWPPRTASMTLLSEEYWANRPCPSFSVLLATA